MFYKELSSIRHYIGETSGKIWKRVNKTTRERAVTLIEKQGLHVTRVSDECIIHCEWCEKTSKAVHVGFVENMSSIQSMQSTIFEDKNFCYESEWFVCGTCNS